MKTTCNLQLAQKILNKIKKNIQSSNDIIPKCSLPRVYEDELEQYQKQFGKKFDELMEYNQKLAAIRLAVCSIVQQLNINNPIFISYLATARFGRGECAEVSNAATLELLKEGRLNDAASICVINPNNVSANHSFILLGDTTKLNPDKGLEGLKSLDDECILLDPFLNVVCQANQYDQNEGLKKYYAIYEIKEFADIQVFSAFKKELLTDVEKNTDEVYQQTKDILPVIKLLSPENADLIDSILKEQEMKKPVDLSLQTSSFFAKQCIQTESDTKNPSCKLA